jgi:hypothetical protein
MPDDTQSEQIPANTGEEGFLAYPQGYIFAIVDDRSEAGAVVTDLQDAGFSVDDILTFAGPDGAESLDSSGKEHGLTARLIRFVESRFAEMDHLKEYQAAVERGSVVIGVHADGDERRQRATEAVLAHDVRFVHAFGQFAVEALRP